MKIAVAIATTGRPDILAATLQRLARQERAPDHVLVVGAAETDFPSPQTPSGKPLDDPPRVAFTLASKGSSKQRNRALDLLDGKFDAIIFLDDDFVPARDFIAGAERLLREHPDVVIASGRILADGIRTAGISFAEADRIIAAYERDGLGESASRIVDRPGAYGCNMVVRVAAMPEARFDENLPLYGWLEDLDFSSRFAKVGRVVETGLCVGVHLGVKSGRSPGLQVGYSHIANPIYLAGKGSLSWPRALTMAGKVLIANLVRSLAPEPYVDRRGRLVGNLRAIADLFSGRLHPMRVLDLPTGRAERKTGHVLS